MVGKLRRWKGSWWKEVIGGYLGVMSVLRRNSCSVVLNTRGRELSIVLDKLAREQFCRLDLRLVQLQFNDLIIQVNGR